MHEASLVQAVLTQVADFARQHRARRVTRVRVRIGEQAGVETDLFQFAFDALSRDSICNGARLEIVPEAVEWKCGNCGAPIRAGDHLQCEACGWPARMVQGGSLILEQIELEAS